MNEKIRELRQQATIIVGAESGFAFDREVLDEEKFAELIVKECAELIESQHTWITSVAASALIRKHFRIK